MTIAGELGEQDLKFLQLSCEKNKIKKSLAEEASIHIYDTYTDKNKYIYIYVYRSREKERERESERESESET